MALYDYRDIEARVYYLPPEEGGRSTPIYNGYRPHLTCDGAMWSAIHELIDKDFALPGEVARTYLTFICPEGVVNKLQIGQEFSLCEGSRVIGVGVVLSLIDLEQHALESLEQNTRRSSSSDPDSRVPDQER